MVGMQVADDDARQVRGFEPTGEARERALAQVEAERRPVVEHDVARRGGPGSIRVRGA